MKVLYNYKGFIKKIVFIKNVTISSYNSHIFLIFLNHLPKQFSFRLSRPLPSTISFQTVTSNNLINYLINKLLLNLSTVSFSSTISFFFFTYYVNLINNLPSKLYFPYFTFYLHLNTRSVEVIYVKVTTFH